MSDNKIDGNAIAKKIREELTQEITALKEVVPDYQPTLAVILVGSRKDSQTYVNMKTKSCLEVGIKPLQFDMPESTTEAELIALVDKLSNDDDVHGILVQLPLPKHINADNVIERINPKKDSDGLTTNSFGDLLSKGLNANYIPCTPLGCIKLLQYSNVEVKGKKAVVIGRSKLVGKPLALCLLSLDATVTICHSKTQNLPDVVREADLVFAAIGVAEFVKGEWIKDGAVVIDVGINAVDDATKKAGYRLVGDVEYSEAVERASLITPVPGGVGPMTVAMLLHNTLKGFKMQYNLN